jgi:hypothetical protein
MNGLGLHWLRAFAALPTLKFFFILSIFLVAVMYIFSFLFFLGGVNQPNNRQTQHGNGYYQQHRQDHYHQQYHNQHQKHQYHQQQQQYRQYFKKRS